MAKKLTATDAIDSAITYVNEALHLLTIQNNTSALPIIANLRTSIENIVPNKKAPVIVEEESEESVE